MNWFTALVLGKAAGWAGFVVFCWLIDFVIMPSPLINRYDFLRAPTDNAAHGLIAISVWLLSMGRPASSEDLLYCLSCGAAASAIDLDHFIAAGSWRLKAALTLQHRPFMHASTWWLVPVALFALGRWQASKRLLRVSQLLAVAVVSHHLRDGHRRGLWFPPLGSTAPLPWWSATLGMCALAIVVAHLSRSSSSARHVLVTPFVQSV